MTKAEQIKQMSKHELAKEINILMNELCRRFCKGCKNSGHRCETAVNKYLESEVTE